MPNCQYSYLSACRVVVFEKSCRKNLCNVGQCILLERSVLKLPAASRKKLWLIIFSTVHQMLLETSQQKNLVI